MGRTSTKAPPTARRPSAIVGLVLLGLCLSLLALRVTYTEAPTTQTVTLPESMGDAIYSLTVSGLLIFGLVFWLLWQVWSGRPIYRVTGIEIGLAVFLAAGILSTFGASDKRVAINHVVMLAAPVFAAILLVQILDSASRVRAVLLVIGALGVVTVYQCAEQFLVSNEITVEQYEKDPEILLRPLGIEPGTFQQFLFEHRLYSRGIRGFFTTSNSAASFLLLASFAALALLLQHTPANTEDRTRLRRRYYAPIAAMIVLAGLLMTKSKGGILAFCIAAGLFGVFLLLRRRLAAHPRLAWVAGVALLLVASLAVGGAAVSYGLRHDRLPGGNSMLVRWQYWRASVQMYGDHALAGVGPGNFAQNYTRYKPASAPESVSDPHCFPLSVLTQYGPLGLLGFLAMFLIPIYRGTSRPTEPLSLCVGDESGPRRLAVAVLLTVSAALLLLRSLLIPGTSEGDFEVVLYEVTVLYIAPVAAFLIGFLLLAAALENKPVKADVAHRTALLAALGCAVAGVLLHNLIDFAIFEPGVWTALWTLMACLVAISRPMQVPASLGVSHPKPLKLVASFVALLLLGAYVQFVWRPVYESTAGLQQGRQAASIGRFDRAHALLDTASAADALSPAAAYLNGRLYLQEAERASAGGTSLLEKAAQCLRTAIDRDPADYKNYEKAGDIASLMGKPEDAYGWYAEAAARYPGSGRLQLRLAQAAEQQGDMDAALRHYRHAIEIEDAFQRQFRQMYPAREQPVSRLGWQNYELAKRRIAELAN